MPWSSEEWSLIHDLSQTLTPYDQRPTKIYINFSTHTNPTRKNVVDHFKSQFSGASDMLIHDGRIGLREYLTDMNNAQFVVSPPGRPKIGVLGIQ